MSRGKEWIAFSGLLLSVTMSGCAGTLTCFHNDRDFEAYVTHWDLRNRSLFEDRALLTADGYHCDDTELDEAALVCTKSCKSYYGEYERATMIDLDPSDEGPSHTKVRWWSIIPL